MKGKLLLGGMAVVVTGIFIALEVFRPPASAAGEEAAYILTAQELAAAYAVDEQAGNEKFLGKILQVSGEIHEIEGGTPLTVVLNGQGVTRVRVELQVDPNHLPEAGSEVIVKGSCSGLLLDVVLNNGAIIE